MTNSACDIICYDTYMIMFTYHIIYDNAFTLTQQESTQICFVSTYYQLAPLAINDITTTFHLYMLYHYVYENKYISIWYHTILLVYWSIWQILWFILVLIALGISTWYNSYWVLLLISRIVWFDNTSDYTLHPVPVFACLIRGYH